MKKTIIALSTVAVVGLGSAFFSDSVHAETIDELNNKQSEIKNERSEVKANLTKAEAKIADVLYDLKEINEEIARVDDTLKQNQKAMEEVKEDIKETKNEMEVLEEEIIEFEDAIEVRYDILKQRITSLQKTGGTIGYLDVLFGSNSFGELISRVSAVTKITNSDAELIEQQEEDKNQVEIRQNKVKDKLAEQNDMKVELEGMKILIVDQKEQNDKSKKDIQKKEKKLKTLKSDLETKDNDLATMEAEIRQDIASARTPAPAPVTSNSNISNDNHSNLETLGSTKSKTPKPVSSSGDLGAAINAGYGHIGTPYQWGGKGPGGFDCSGFVSWAYGEAGYSIPSSTAGLSGTGQKVSSNNMQPGDLVFFDTYKKNGHVGIYVGNGQFIGAQNSGLDVASMSNTYWKDTFKGHVRRVK